MGLTHIDETGRAKMVDVSDKPVTRRVAIASGYVQMDDATIQAIRDRATPKGDPVEAARIAGIMAAKKTPELIPLCHPLPLASIDIRIELVDSGCLIEAEVISDSKTGVEMEALTAVSAAALTIYDMCKAIDRSMVITSIRLESKTGGRSGDFKRAE
jgi:cyclic pyranopterin phosphate synthase